MKRRRIVPVVLTVAWLGAACSEILDLDATPPGPAVDASVADSGSSNADAGAPDGTAPPAAGDAGEDADDRTAGDSGTDADSGGPWTPPPWSTTCLDGGPIVRGDPLVVVGYVRSRIDAVVFNDATHRLVEVAEVDGSVVRTPLSDVGSFSEVAALVPPNAPPIVAYLDPQGFVRRTAFVGSAWSPVVDDAGRGYAATSGMTVFPSPSSAEPTRILYAASVVTEVPLVDRVLDTGTLSAPATWNRSDSCETHSARPFWFARHGGTNGVVFVGFDDQIHDLDTLDGTKWNDLDLTVLGGGSMQPNWRIEVTAYVRSDGADAVVYVDDFGHVWELATTTGDAGKPWRGTDLTAVTGAGPVTTRAVGYVRWDGTNAVVATDASGTIWSFEFSKATSTWSAARLPLAVVPSPVASALSVSTRSDGASSILYRDSAGRVMEARYSLDGTWRAVTRADP